MAFLNIYDKEENYFYQHAIKSGNDIYFVGKIEQDFLVLKTDLLGNILWEKRYSNPYTGELMLRSVTNCDNGDILIFIDEIDSPDFVLIRIGTVLGAIVWSKRYQLAYSGRSTIDNIGNDVYILRSPALGSDYGAESVRVEILLKLNGLGVIQAKKVIGISGDQTNTYSVGRRNDRVTSDANYIYIASSKGFLKFDHNLVLVNKFRFLNGEPIDQIKIINGSLRISGSIVPAPNQSATFLVFVPFPNSPLNQQINAKVYRRKVGYSICNSSSIFIPNTYPIKTVDKYDIATNTLLWSKKVDTTEMYYDLYVTDEEIIFYNYRNTYSATPIVNMVGVTNLDFENCKVTPDTAPLPFPDMTITVTSDFILTITENVTLVITPVNHTVIDVESVKLEQCTNPAIPVTNNTMLQSSHFYMQAAGSMGADSTKGIHLRWLLKKGLKNHLPKGNYATTNANFNKEDDFVKIYRAPYTPKKTVLDFNVAPTNVNDNFKRWIYTIGNKMFYVHFRSASLYTQVRASINPATNTAAFIASYFTNNGIMEVENQNELSFGITSYFNSGGQGNVKVEYLSVDGNVPSAPKLATLRKTLAYSVINAKKMFSENIRSIRLQSTGTYPLKMEFECYSDFLAYANSNQMWDEVGEHALTLDDNIAFGRLEPEPNTVHGKWLRYNDSAFVNIQNYKAKWNSSSLPATERIKECVSTYISLSNNASNPMALEEFLYDTISGQPGQPSFEISNLYLLQVASLDYHTARMMGLGVLDIENELNQGQFIYAARYTTFGDLQDGLGAREVDHVYMSLPTGLNDQRLPLPIDLDHISPGIFTSNEVEAPISITDDDGYTPDGRARFLSLYHKAVPQESANAAFFSNNFEFVSEQLTKPVFAGIEYRRQNEQWRKPELPFNGRYLNIDATVNTDYEKSETRSIVVPQPGNPLFIHRENQNGIHDYSSYGINWFGRATASSVILSIETIIVPANQMLPPTNVRAALIQKELPLLLTSAAEQLMLQELPEGDKTLIRVSCEYNHAQELVSYQQKVDGEFVPGYAELPDGEEPFAEYLELFYRNSIPQSLAGKVQSTQVHSNNFLIRIHTEPFVLLSTAEDPQEIGTSSQTLEPTIQAGTEANYIGSVMLVNGVDFIIEEIDNSGAYPVFTVWKRNEEGSLINAPLGTPATNLIIPESEALFLIVENMQVLEAWNTTYNTNPLNLKINIDHTTIHRESIVDLDIDGVPITYLHKFRGILKPAVISKVFEDVNVNPNPYEAPILESRHLGLYEITFPDYSLEQHSQFPIGPDTVEFYKGIVRVHTLNDPLGRRKELNVIDALHIGEEGIPLVLFASDPAFPSDPAELGDYEGRLMQDASTTINQVVNYYPGYKVYLHTDPTHGLTEEYILPGEDEDHRNSIFGLRSYDSLYDYYSNISVPAIMFARKLEEPRRPKLPGGGMYATRPDFFGKATYTFTTEFEHKPYSVQFSRGSDVQILTSLYEGSTIQTIIEDIFQNGEEPFYMNLWGSLFVFDYPTGQYEKFPDEEGVSMPLPDSTRLITEIQQFVTDHNQFYTDEPDVPPFTGITSLNQVVIPVTDRHGELTVTDFVRETLHNCFVPLTEIPVIYKYINGPLYTPLPKKQTIRDRNGNMLTPGSVGFDMAPMMKIMATSPLPKIQFTDFGIDGASNAQYFYIAREINLQMQTGPYSDILGPVQLVNTNPPPAPDIIKILSVLEDRALGILPAIHFSINAYQASQGITKINLYRTTDPSNSLSVRTMELVKIIDVETEGMAEQDRWVFTDEFADLGFVPYGDILYYRITVSRRIEYNDIAGEPVTDYAPSEATEVVITNVVNNYSPDSPQLSYSSNLIEQGVLNSVVLSWEQTVYNGKYHLYKLGSQGNWVRIEEVISNSPIIEVPIGSLTVIDSEGNRIYHHFKVIAENMSGMRSTQENILTIFKDSSPGIGEMIIEETFVVR